MPIDLGLLSEGLSSAVKQGLGAYDAVRKRQQQQQQIDQQQEQMGLQQDRFTQQLEAQKDQQESQRQMGMLRSGYQEDEKGILSLRPETAKQQELDRRQKEAQIGLLGAQTEAARAKSTAAPKEVSYKPTQYQAGLYARRMEQAQGVFDDLQKSGYQRGAPTEAMLAGILPEFARSEKLKKQDQAERNFVNAVLRRESGAAIADSEFKSAEQQYFPRAGDPPSVLEQKRTNRELALQGIKAEAGGAFEQIPSARTLARQPNETTDGLISEAIAKDIPKKGQLVDGYIFNGGDPGDQNNWIKSK